MKSTRAAATAAAVALTLPALLLARQNIVKNGSVEYGGGAGAIDQQIADQWTEVGVNVERSAQYSYVPSTGHALKAFGDGDNTSVAAYQEVPGFSPGQSVTATVRLFSPANDKLGGSGQAGLRLEFLDFFGGTLGGIHETYVLNSSSPADTWLLATVGPFTAPANTVKVRITCRLTWTIGNVSGAAYWDDVQVTANGGPNTVANGDFETAGPSPGQSAYGIDDWLGFNDQEKSDAFAEHGSYSLQLGTHSNYSGLYQEMKQLVDGDHLYMIAWVLNPSSDPLTGSSRAGIKLEFSVPGGAPPPIENLPFTQDSPNDVWTLVTLDTTVPDDVTVAKAVMVYFADGGTTGSVYVDSARAERGGAPGVNQLLNPSFEQGLGGADGLTNWLELYSDGVSQLRKSCFAIPAHNGNCTAKGTGAAPAFLVQEFTVVPGESLHLEAYFRSPATDPLTGGAAKCGVKLEWVLGTLPDVVDIGDQENQILAGAPQNTWLPVVIDYEMPAGTAAITRFVDIIEKGSGLTGKVYFDSHEAVVTNVFNGCDADGDDDQDMIDFANFQRCYNGPSVTPPWNCIVNDANDDGDVDGSDWDYFRPRITGPN